MEKRQQSRSPSGLVALVLAPPPPCSRPDRHARDANAGGTGAHGAARTASARGGSGARTGRASLDAPARLAGLLAVVIALGGCARAHLVVPSRLPDRAQAWPIAEGMNLVQLRLDLLARRFEGTPLGDRSLAHELVGRVAGLRRILEECRLTPDTRLERVLLGLQPFDRIAEGAVLAIQGELDAPAVVRCVAGVSPKLVLRPMEIGPYPAMRGHLGKRAVLVVAIARDTVVLAVGAEAERVPRLLLGQDPAIAHARLDRHLGADASDAALTVTIARFLESRLNMFTSSLLFATRLLRSGWLQARLGEGGGLRIRGAIEARGPAAALRLHLRWKVLTAILGALDADARVLLGAIGTDRVRREIRFNAETGQAQRQAFGRLVDRLLKRLAKKKPTRPAPGAASPERARPAPLGSEP